eukprot:PhF_6_TR19157/c0_g1_i1/m.28173/K17732/PMPCB, MAS1; mitochondrial-processing peptidase subunit beta
MSVSFSTVIQKLRPRPNAGSNLLTEYLAKIQPTNISNLPNGLRVASEQGRGEFATVGVYINSGSRYEDRATNGAASLLQKVALNSTANMNKGALGTTIEEIGGHLGAYTTRDRTAFYVKCLKSDVPRAVALLAELVRNPNITDDTVESARKSLLQDIKDNEEDQELVMFDNLHLAAYDSTEQGYGVAATGTPESVKGLSTSSILKFKSDNWNASRMVLVGAGGVEHGQLEALGKQYFGDLGQGAPRPKLESRYVGGDIKLWNLRQKVTHIAWGFETCGAECGDFVPLSLVTHIYGKFHRSNHDLTQHSSQIQYKCTSAMDFSSPTHTFFPEKAIETVQPFYHVHEDTGLMGLHMVMRCEPNGPGSATNMWDMIQLTMGDMCRLTQKVCHPQELEQAKVNYKAQLLMNNDGSTNVCEDIARQVHAYGRRVPIDEMFNRIDDVTPTNVMETLQHYFYARRPVLSAVGYCYMIPSYDQVHTWTWKYMF